MKTGVRVQKMNKSFKVMLYGYGSRPFFYKPMIEIAKEKYKDIEWFCILPTQEHKELMINCLGEEHVLYLFDEFKRIREDCLDINILENYKGNFYADIAADKRHLIKAKASKQMHYALKTYQVYKEYLMRIKPDCVFFPSIQGMDGTILYSLADELGIKKILPAYTRHLNKTFFSETKFQSLPDYARIDKEDQTQAEAFLSALRENGFKPISYTIKSDEKEVVTFYHPRFYKRVKNFAPFIRSLFYEREGSTLRWKARRFVIKFASIKALIRKTRGKVNKRHKNISSLDQLPDKFIYYPLQVTPEASINTPAPYYVDQLRAIDAIRLSIPSDFYLIVKEHPAGLSKRPGKFMKKLLCTAGVIVMDYQCSSIELIKKAKLTISVTGTATLEAFLMGKPSVTLGNNFITEFIGGKCELSELETRIRRKIDSQISDEEIIQALAKIYNVSENFVLISPGTKHVANDTMSVENIRRFLDAFVTHLVRSRMYAINHEEGI